MNPSKQEFVPVKNMVYYHHKYYFYIYIKNGCEHLEDKVFQMMCNTVSDSAENDIHCIVFYISNEITIFFT